jgi:probable rRNA maturation factor
MPHGPAATDHSLTRQSKLGFELSLANEQSAHAVDQERLLSAARSVLEDSRFKSATISLAVVDDATIHAINLEFLEHDYPTDVLSFTLDDMGGHLNGEIVLSADTAAEAACEHSTTAAHEQLLYVIHGMLHLVGYDDVNATDAERMRSAEQQYLRQCGGPTGK